jgi:hypothetical protein
VGKVLRCVFRISVAEKLRRPRGFPNRDAIPEQNKLGGTVIPGKCHRRRFMQFTDESATSSDDSTISNRIMRSCAAMRQIRSSSASWLAKNST